ncbi:MAG: hypothetical protein RJQ14_03920 [Marinoscillum sp.]
MRNPPESVMIFREELRKAKLEKARMKRLYESEISKLSVEMLALKKRLCDQEEQVKACVDHSSLLEQRLLEFKSMMEEDELRNGSGYH